MTRGRVVALAAIALACALLPARPAAADPPAPTNDRSTVTGTEPDLPPGVAIRVVGGDGFLELTNEGPATVIVPDYSTDADGEDVPYLRFSPDGTVERNERADATLLNESRYGRGAPGGTRRPPEWQVVSTSGTFAWHDHRIHWMSTSAPATDADGQVDMGGPGGSWEVPILADGAEIVVQGELRVVGAPSPLGWIAAIVLVAGGIVVASRRWSSSLPLAAAASASALALVVARDQWAAAPAGSGATPLGIVVVVVGLLACGIAAAADRTPWASTARILGSSAAAACLLAWGALRWGVLTHAILPTDLAPWFDRGVTSLAIATGLAFAASLVLPTSVRSSRTA